MCKQSDVTIIVPALNEETSIGLVLSDLQSVLPEVEIVVVNDGSTDNTASIAKKAGVKVINHHKNFGYGTSLRNAILASDREYVLTCDADGQHRAVDVKRMIEENNGCDMLIGCRDNESHQPLMRRPGKFVLRHFANYLAGQKIPDLNSGLRMIRREVILKYMHLMPSGFSFSSTSTFAFLKGTYRVEWLPITVNERIGKSTVSLVKHGPQTMMLMIRLTVLFEPLKVFLTAFSFSFLLFLISISVDIAFADDKGIGDATVILFISSILIFLFGLVCDQVAALRREFHE